jgi:hypothetical protein
MSSMLQLLVVTTSKEEKGCEDIHQKIIIYMCDTLEYFVSSNLNHNEKQGWYFLILLNPEF